MSKILVFLLVPFYTNVLTTADYGIADVMQTTLLLLVPALTVNMGEAALRFGIDRSERRAKILRIGVKYVLRASIIVAAVCVLSCAFVKPDVRWYLFLFIFLFLTNSMYEFLILFFQGCEKVKIVVCGSVADTEDGKACEAEADFEKELVAYGVPMIAYSTGSWINNAADRYLVSFIKGVAVNGVYGVAYKIPAILTVFQRIFAQAWQMSATKSYEDDNSSEFFSTMYMVYNTFMVTGCSFLILTVRLLAFLMFKKDFYGAWQYVPPLLISVVFGALTGFLGSICLAFKDSKAMGFATGLGAAVNIILNIILIPRYSAMGAAIATGISYFLMYFIAYIKVSKYVKLEIKLLRDHLSYILLVFEAFIMITGSSLKMSTAMEYISSGVIFLMIVLMNIKEINSVMRKLFTAMLKKKN